MFDRLEDIVIRLEEILRQLNEPGVAAVSYTHLTLPTKLEV